MPKTRLEEIKVRCAAALDVCRKHCTTPGECKACQLSMLRGMVADCYGLLEYIERLEANAERARKARQKMCVQMNKQCVDNTGKPVCDLYDICNPPTDKGA